MSTHCHPPPAPGRPSPAKGAAQRYLEAELLGTHHGSQPGEGSVDEGQQRQEGNQVGSDVPNQLHGDSGPTAGCF